MALVNDLILPPDAEQRAAYLAAGLAEAARFGITAYTEPGVNSEELRTDPMATDIRSPTSS